MVAADLDGRVRLRAFEFLTEQTPSITPRLTTTSWASGQT